MKLWSSSRSVCLFTLFSWWGFSSSSKLHSAPLKLPFERKVDDWVSVPTRRFGTAADPSCRPRASVYDEPKKKKNLVFLQMGPLKLFKLKSGIKRPHSGTCKYRTKLRNTQSISKVDYLLCNYNTSDNPNSHVQLYSVKPPSPDCWSNKNTGGSGGGPPYVTISITFVHSNLLFVYNHPSMWCIQAR